MNVEELDDGQLAYLITKAVQEQGRRAIARRAETVEEDALWPTPVFEAALDVFGPVVYANGRVRKVLALRISHAYSVWRDRYGPLNPEQEEYAAKLLASAIRSVPAVDGHVPYPQVYARLLDVVTHEKVHDGFTARSGAERRELVTPGMREAE